MVIMANVGVPFTLQKQSFYIPGRPFLGIPLLLLHVQFYALTPTPHLLILLLSKIANHLIHVGSTKFSEAMVCKVGCYYYASFIIIMR
jgi:hypothetical protein